MNVTLYSWLSIVHCISILSCMAKEMILKNDTKKKRNKKKKKKRKAKVIPALAQCMVQYIVSYGHQQLQFESSNLIKKMLNDYQIMELSCRRLSRLRRLHDGS